MKTDTEILKQIDSKLIALRQVEQVAYVGITDDNNFETEFYAIIEGTLSALEKAVVKRVLNPRRIFIAKKWNLYNVHASAANLEYGPIYKSDPYKFILYSEPDSCKLSGPMSWDWTWDRPVTYFEFHFKYKTKNGKITQIG